MRKRDNESVELWAERVRIYELGIAYQRIANGEDPLWVMHGMSNRIMDKILHPMLLALKDNIA